MCGLADPDTHGFQPFPFRSVGSSRRRIRSMAELVEELVAEVRLVDDPDLLGGRSAVTGPAAHGDLPVGDVVSKIALFESAHRIRFDLDVVGAIWAALE